MKLPRHILLCLLIVPINLVFGQEMESLADSTTRNNSPYDLISIYYQTDFDPFVKGTWYAGLAFSVEDRSRENTQRLLDKVINGDNFNFDIEVKGGYHIGDYVQTGVNFTFEQQKFEGLTLREGDTINVQSVSQTFMAIPFIKSYFPLTKNERLSFFTEIGVGLGGGSGLTRETKNLDDITKTESQNFQLQIGFTPGITFFAIEDFAFEVGIQVIGYTMRINETEVDEDEVSRDVRHNVNLNINLLTLKLGLAYYF